MQYTVLLDKNENTKQVELQEQSRFIKSIIEALGVPIEFNSEKPLSVDDRIRLRKELDKYDISIITDIEGGVKIFVKTDLIGEWYKSIYKLKEDLSQRVNPKKKIYLEMTVRFWTTFENEVEAK
jgi:hypothetical protein